MARDRRFDGRFVVGVLSTGVFCRPICPAWTPRPENARYFASPAAALAAGYRPCRRCRPEVAPAAPASSLGSNAVLCAQTLVLRLAFRNPYHAVWVFSFLQERAIPGLESVAQHCYRRRIGADDWVEAQLDGNALRVSIPAAAIGQTTDLLVRLRRLFDLDADPAAIDAHLAQESTLAPLVGVAPGLRVPGVWDAFEGAIRAILGQQVSVQRATALATTLCERFADGAFPKPEALAGAEVAAIGMPGTRGRAISAVARRTLSEGDGWLKDAAALRAGFAEIRGLGPWTAEYAAMRVGGDPDAFPDSDWGVWKALGCKGAAARRWAEPCRPWRSYATMHLWLSRTTL